MISTTLLPLLALTGVAYADSISLPLNRRSLHHNLTLEKITAAADNLRFKYGIKSAVEKRQGQSAAIPVINQVCFFSSSYRLQRNDVVRLEGDKVTSASEVCPPLLRYLYHGTAGIENRIPIHSNHSTDPTQCLSS